jgi:hypothetical protein
MDNNSMAEETSYRNILDERSKAAQDYACPWERNYSPSP